MSNQNEAWHWDLPAQFNIGTACTDQHANGALADQPAMVVEDADQGTSQATYAELAAASSKFAQLLRNRDIDVGERVLIRMPNSLAYPVAFFGAMKRGAISVPTSTLLVGEEVRYLAEDSGASVLVTAKSMWAELREGLADLASLKLIVLSGPGEISADDPRCVDLEAELAQIEQWDEPHPTTPDDPAYLVYTSGTTGHPKGVLHGHRAMIGRSPAAKYWFDFKDGDRIMHSGKFNWTYVLGSALMDPLYYGKTVVVYEGPNDPLIWPSLIAKHNCTMFIGVPTIYRQIIQKTEYGAKDLPSLRYCMSAGEHLSDEMFEAWRERFGMEVYEAIGMSEISYYISHNKFHDIRPGSAGFPQPGHDVRLLDADLNEVGPDEEGMISIPADDPGLFINYWNLPEETAKARHDGYFFTGDYARKDADGYIWFLGRRDDIINTFGYRVSPHEVERVIKTHDEVADCVAIGQEMGAEKTLVAACVVLVPGAKVTEAELLAYGEEHLAGYKRPKLVHVMEDFPRTKNGKVIRSQLKTLVDQRKAS
jgi:acyl-coenzyme A synthetase/AMP-(fatty) acid ligase